VLRVQVLSATPYWHEREFRAMGSPAHLIVGGAHEPLVDWAVAEVERLEQSWSRFRPDSELSRLAGHAGAWRPVSAELMAALARARRLWEHTAGAFDPTVLAALEAMGYDRTFAAVARDAGALERPPVPAPGFDRVEIDEGASAVRLPPGVRLDLGGIGKGLAADLVAEGLVLRGAASVLVGLGGDVRTAGHVPDGGWRVPVLDPFDETATWSEAVLGAEAIVTSTSLLRSWRRGGQALHHIVDPLTGSPTDTGVVAVVARGGSAWWAEGLAKAAMVLGEAGADALLDGTDVGATLFRADGSSVTIGVADAPCPR
jgi:thiamine biosynthesis lipoprotein